MNKEVCQFCDSLLGASQNRQLLRLRLRLSKYSYDFPKKLDDPEPEYYFKQFSCKNERIYKNKWVNELFVSLKPATAMQREAEMNLAPRPLVNASAEAVLVGGSAHLVRNST